MKKKYLLRVLLLNILILGYCLNLKAQNNMDNFETQWTTINKLINNGLPKSALDELDKIYNSALKKKNATQILKVLLFKMNLYEDLEENANAKSIDTLEQQILLIPEPAKSMLESITAEAYLKFFNENRYRLYDRTETENFDKKDINTWTVADFHKRISELYLASLQNETLLKETNLTSFDPIILAGRARYLRPTLFDFLAHRALEYFSNRERDVIRPAYAFQLNNPQIFAPAKDFISLVFPDKDSTSLQLKALHIYQSLLSFHLKDKNPAALIDADLARIEFANEFGVMQEKKKLYLNALKGLVDQYGNDSSAAQATYQYASALWGDASNKDVLNLENSIADRKIALQLLEKIAQSFPKTQGGNSAQNLLSEIKHSYISVITEKVNVPGSPFRTLVKYRNLNKAHFRILRLTPELKSFIDDRGYNNEGLFKKLVTEKAVHSFSQQLPGSEDYLWHSTEVKIDALPTGQYIMLLSGNENFSIQKNPLAAEYFYVSNISFVNYSDEYFILDRTTGKPLAGAKAQIWVDRYNEQKRTYELRKREMLLANQNGYFKIKDLGKEGERSIKLEITYNNDKLFLDEQQYIYRNRYNDYEQIQVYKNQEEYDKDNGRVYFFTDRSLYRPSQTVFFKGIGITQNWETRKSQLLPNGKVFSVLLYDANHQKIDSQKVTLNEFGSFSGKFILPEGKMNGSFSIAVNDRYGSGTNFSVEEYKRPKFYTEFDNPKESFRVNDTIIITGNAKAYAGNNIDGAKVTFRVTREARFLYPWMFWRRPLPSSSSMEIVNGEMETDADGKFVIRFAAIPDLSIDPKTDPVFDYRVSADVTDLNGETRSGNITIPVGYKSINLQILLSDKEVINKDSLSNIRLSSKNLSGEPQSVSANIKIYALQAPDRLIRQRLWDEPDQFVIPEREYIQLFPHDEYKDETQMQTWKKSLVLFEQTDSVYNNTAVDVKNMKWQSGWYVVEATAHDRYGQEVKDVKYFQVYDNAAKKLPAPGYIWSVQEKSNLQPGALSTIITGSSTDIFLIQQIDKQSIKDRADSNFKFINLNKSIKNFDFPITEADRGGFGVYQFFVRDNRFYRADKFIHVPWKNKELTISFDTYRDKTLPGSEEKWKVNIKGSKGEKVAAEMLASMYDASLDQFKPHSWTPMDLWRSYSGFVNWTGQANFATVQSFSNYWRPDSGPYIDFSKKYDRLNFFDNARRLKRMMGLSNSMSSDDVLVSAQAAPSSAKMEESKFEMMTDSTFMDSDGDGVPTSIDSNNEGPSAVQIRKNFNETVFFYPDLKTDKEGNISFSFTMPEALTKWRLMAMSHTKDLATGYAEASVITQKELMVQPNAPRFVREGDKLLFSAKVVNLSAKELSGQAELQLLNATTMNPVDGWFKNVFPVQHFTAGAGQSTVVNFQLEIPTNFNNAVVYRIIAKAGNMSDGEEMAIPVVTNRMLVTESMPLPMRGNGSKNFSFEKLLQSGNSPSLTQYGLTVEYTTNPAWYAVQSMPYLVDYPYECSEQTFNKFYANALALKIANSSPRIKAIFEKWKTEDTAALMSNLQKNEELKAVLLEETPWVMQAQNEAQQKKNIALLFDMVKMGKQLQGNMEKILTMQTSNGGFSWFKGGRDDRYVTQYIVSGIGHLKKLNAMPAIQESELKGLLAKAIPYLDQMIKKDYDDLIKYKSDLSKNNLSTIAIQYLYMRSFFPEYKVSNASKIPYDYYMGQSKKFWLQQSKYMQGMIALYLNRSADAVTAKAIISSLKENAIVHPELGMYWKDWDQQSYWWYRAPIESQSMMIEAFTEIGKDQKTIGDLKTWLLKNKQTNNWKTTKATAEAIYALLLQGTDWLSEEKQVVIKLGNYIMNSKDEKQQEGSGYFKRKIDGDKVKPEMGKINVTVSSPTNTSATNVGGDMPSWGSVYWQYFEDLDKITFAETPLKLSKKLFVEKNTPTGPVLNPINEGDDIHIGDKIKVRIELRVDRDMEYVHMKDMRASAMEPVNVISAYKWQGGLGYYESTKDISTNFFFSYLPKGTYVFEYPMFVTHAGNFSNGITTIQCMYAPEFTAHSEGVRINVK